MSNRALATYPAHSTQATGQPKHVAERSGPLFEQERQAILALLELARAASYAADNGERMMDGSIVVTLPDAARLIVVLDQLNGLPVTNPDNTLSGPGRAERALRRLLPQQ